MITKRWDSGLWEQRTAEYSDCERYRYTLDIAWGIGPAVNFLMLNPSKATEQRNDPTVERCQRRVAAMGFNRLIVTNLFAYRATDPADMLSVADPVGPDNDLAIEAGAKASAIVICAWGLDGGHLGRGVRVRDFLRGYCPDRLYYLSLCNDGSPGHPLYTPYAVQPTKWVA